MIKYTKKILDNDMCIVMAPRENTRIISVGFFINAGSRNETDENNGVAHFLEHMMFKGTKNRNAEKLLDELDTMGSQYNAATTMQFTYYYAYSNSDDMKKLLDIMLDIYLNTIFDNNELNKERKVIVEEKRMREDYPFAKLYTKMHQQMFKGTSLAREIIGNDATIDSLKKKDLEKFRNAMYIPRNTVFVICGNFSPAPVFNILKKILNPLPNKPIADTMKYDYEKSIILKRMQSQSAPYIYVKKSSSFQQTYVILSFPMYDLYDSKDSEIDLLTQLLSSGFSSRLSKALRENEGITYASAAYPIVYSDCGLFLIQMTISPTELVKGIKIVLKELKKLKEEPMTKEEMIKIVKTTENESIYALEKPNEILMYLGLTFAADRNADPDVEKELRDLKNTKRTDIQKVAQQIFIKTKLNLFIYGNISQTDYSFIDF